MAFLEYSLGVSTDFDSFARLQTHAEMISDTLRTDAFKRAIEASTSPGAHVVEIGAGSGVLGHMALAAGAGSLTAIEASSMAELLPAVLDRSRARVLHCRSDQAELPAPADLIIMELLGHVGIDEGIIDAAQDAKRRLLDPVGTIIPNRLRVVAWPVEAASFADSVVGFWKRSPYGLPAAPLAREARKRTYIFRGESMRRAGFEQTLWDFALGEAPDLESELSFTIQTPMRVDGMVVSFVATLSPGIELQGWKTTNWYPVFVPFEEPVDAQTGQTLRWCCKVDSAGRWHTRLTDS